MLRAPSLLALVASLAASTLGGCLQSPDAESCDPPVSVALEPLSSVSCEERADVGYRSGTPFDITVVTVDGRPVERETANAYFVMAEAAARDGVEIRIVSGFRTMAEQEHLYHCYASCSCNDCNLAARPGYSNHQSGHALDLNTGSGAGVLTWLNAHGADFGFERTVPSEPWHWEWWGGGPGGGPCPACRAHCEGSVIVGDDCRRGDCAAFGSRCVDDALGVRCAFFACPDVGDATVCIDEATLGTCHDGAVAADACATLAPGTTCVAAEGSAECVLPPEPSTPATTDPTGPRAPDESGADPDASAPSTEDDPRVTEHRIGQSCGAGAPGSDRDGGRALSSLLVLLALAWGRRR
jgi:hypothetical protein